MWSTHMWSTHLLITIAVLEIPAKGNPVSTGFNAHLRDYYIKEQQANSTARTLQQEELGRYANFAPVSNRIRFKEIPDNALSSSSYSRGLAHPEHGGYGLHDYDDNHYGYAFEYNPHGGFDPHSGHHGYHLSHGHHHKHYDHALAAKTILWPLAGLALLGTAAALVSNPVLLQLGVISGRRRRDTKEVAPYFDLKKWNKDVAGYDSKSKNVGYRHSKDELRTGLKKSVFSITQGVLKKAYPTAQSTIESVTQDAPQYNGYIDDDRFVPIPLKIKKY